MTDDRKIILDYLETGRGKEAVLAGLQREEFCALYVEIAKNEAALYEVYSEAVEIRSQKKVSRKKPRQALLIISALAACLAISYFFLFHYNRVARHVASEKWYKSGSHFKGTEDAEFVLADGSQISFAGASDIHFKNSSEIIINGGFLQAKINPRPDDKLTFITPSGNITVIGTEFSLLVKPNSTFLDLKEGKIKIHDKIISENQQALLNEDKQLITDAELIRHNSGDFLLHQLAADNSAAIVSDLSVQKNSIVNLVDGQTYELKKGMTATGKGLYFDEQNALEMIPAGLPSLNWNLSLWAKYTEENRAIASHENFNDQNMGGWKLYGFKDFVRLYTVKQPHFHDRGEARINSSDWFHLSINVRSLDEGRIQSKIYINGQLQVTEYSLMLFLHKQVKFLLGGLTASAMAEFKDKNNYFFKGEIGQLIYFNDNLPEGIIKQLYDSSRQKFSD